MRKIKIVLFVVFLLAIALVLNSQRVDRVTDKYHQEIKTLDEQKDFTQEILKTILYLYQNKESSSAPLSAMVKEFVHKVDRASVELTQSPYARDLWNRFYLQVQVFKDSYKSPSPYVSLTVQKSVKEIYSTNLALIFEFNKLIEQKQHRFKLEMRTYKLVEYMLILFFSILLVYLFFQLRGMVEFVQRFLLISKRVMAESSISELEPLKLKVVDEPSKEAQDSYNAIIAKVQNSIVEYASSIEHSERLLARVEEDIDSVVDLFYEVGGKKRDRELIKKEDAIIHSLEELAGYKKRVADLKRELSELVKTQK
ncbi:MAG: hypothetical protein WCR69_04920 [Sulfuricurvum sp.]